MRSAIPLLLVLLCASGCHESRSNMVPYDLVETIARFKRGEFGPVEQSFVRAYEASSECMGLPTAIVFLAGESSRGRHGSVILYSFGPPERIHYLRVAAGFNYWIVKIDTISYCLNRRVGGVLMRETDVVVARSWDAPSILASGFPVEEVKRSKEISVELFDVNLLPVGKGVVMKGSSNDGVEGFYFKEVLHSSPTAGLSVSTWPLDADGHHQPLKASIIEITP